MNRLKQLINDIRWAILVTKARRWRRELMFSERKAFDDALRSILQPSTDRTAIIAYPDSFYCVKEDDLLRAMRASKGFLS